VRRETEVSMVMTNQVTIGPMRMEDLGRVLEIEQASFPTPWPRDAYTHELRDNRLACYLTARSLHEIVGYAGMWVILEEAHVTTIAVAPDQRRRRIGERLLIALLDESMRRGVRWMTLEVRRTNTGAQLLYQKYGFKEIGVRNGYYSDNREDAIVMWTGNIWDASFQDRLRSLRARLDQGTALEPAHPYVFFGEIIQPRIRGGVPIEPWTPARATGAPDGVSLPEPKAAAADK
jgi:ribosomal-protein-alanine N-acetyltransferase